MTPKEKAKDILLKIRDGRQFAENGKEYTMELMGNGNSKRIALIAVEEILSAIAFNMYDEDAYNKEETFWNDVKTEIEKL